MNFFEIFFAIRDPWHKYIHHVEYFFVPDDNLLCVSAELTTTRQSACLSPTIYENKMARQSELLADVSLEEKSPIYDPIICLYDVRSLDYKDRNTREKAFQEIAQKLQKTGKI